MWLTCVQSIFRRCLPPIRSYVFLPLILLPWIAGAACEDLWIYSCYLNLQNCTCLIQCLLYAVVIHITKPLNYRCHMGAQWIIPSVSLHTTYVAILVAFTCAIRHIEFRFDELRDLWQGILVSASAIGKLLKSGFHLFYICHYKRISFFISNEEAVCLSMQFQSTTLYALFFFGRELYMLFSLNKASQWMRCPQKML